MFLSQLCESKLGGSETVSPLVREGLRRLLYHLIVNWCLTVHTYACFKSQEFLYPSQGFLNPEPHEGNISQKPSLNLWSWLPDMERDILSPQRRVDILLWMGWGRVFSEHLMAITGDLGMGLRSYVCVCDVKTEGREELGEPLWSGFHSWLMSLLDPFPHVSPTK